MAAGDAAAQRPALADEVLLPDELLEVARAHPGGQRLALGRWLEEGFGRGAAGLRRGVGMRRWYARPGVRAARLEREEVHPVDEDLEDGRIAISKPPTMVIRRMSRFDVGVLVGRADRERHRACS